MRNSRRRWSKSIGERGNRVRLYEARPGGPIMRSTWINGKEDRRSLGHRDRELATRQAYELLQGVLATEQAIEEESLTLGMLAKLYQDSPQHLAKKERTRKEDAKKLNRVVNFLGPNRNVVSLSESDVLRFTMARRAGDKSLEGVWGGESVSDRTIELDLVLLMSALNWGTRERSSAGRRLLPENPLHGIKLPKEKNPRRPVMRHDVYLKLLGVAGQVHSLLKLALVVAEGTGRRISGWRNLRWYDVDFPNEQIRWRAEFDKKGFEDVVPMSDTVRDALREARKAQRVIGPAPVFPAPKDPTKPCDRHLLDNWLRRAIKLAKVKPEPGGLWHSLRRKWATERKGYPVKDVAAAGGWRDAETMLTSYQQVDAETVKRVVLHPTQRLMGT
jgi:integrase